MLERQRMILKRRMTIGERQVPQVPGFGHEDEVGEPESLGQCDGGTLPRRRWGRAGFVLRPAESAQQQEQGNCGQSGRARVKSARHDAYPGARGMAVASAPKV